MLFIIALQSLGETEKGFVEKLYVTYEKKMLAMAQSIVGNRHDAEDVVDNVMLKVIENISNFRDKPDREIASQLYVYCKYAVIDVYRKNARRAKEEIHQTNTAEVDIEAEVVSNDPGTDELVITKETILNVRNALTKLQDEYCDVILLRMIYGYSSESSAKILNITPNAVNKRLARAKQKLKLLLSEGNELL